LALGGRLVRGVDLVADAVGLAAACADHDLVLTGEGTFDHTSRTGKVVYGVAERAAAAARPCVVLAGQVTVGSREARAMGVDAAYAVADVVGLEVSMAQPSEALARLAERTARTWSSPS
jgi:glycerate kinase